MNHTRDIPQTFWRDDRLPWLELRSTAQPPPISATATPALGGAIIEGKRAACALAEYLLQPGDLIVIPPHAPHSCNPLHDRPRSYHMLYPTRHGAARSARIFPAPVSPRRSRCCATALFASFQQVVALMSRGSLEQLPARLAQLLHALPLCAAAAGATSRQRPAVSAPGDGSAGVAVAG